jgi:hypothetical protein
VLGAALLTGIAAPTAPERGAPVLAALALEAPTRAAEPSPEQPTDEALAAALARLAPRDAKDAAEWVRSEVLYLPTLQRQLVEAALALDERDAGLWPAAAPAPFYDAAEHAASGGPVERRHVDPTGELAASTKRQLGVDPWPIGLDRAFAYDWSTREVRRLADSDAPEHILAAALRGLPPDADLALALVLRALDRGEEQASLAAFGHAYCDRGGLAFGEITLYDAYFGGSDHERPDVDVLALIHDLENDWKSWKAPIPASAHPKVYARVNQLFKAPRVYRELREAVATAYLAGSIEMPPTYATYRASFNALWQESGDFAALADRLPDAKARDGWIDDWNAHVKVTDGLAPSGEQRARQLEQDEQAVRAVLVDVLRQMKAL